MLKLAILIVLLLATPVRAAELIPAWPPINSGAIACKGNSYSDWWANPTNQTIYVRMVKIWVGLDRTRMADTQVKIWDKNGEVASYHNDRYADPSEQGTHIFDFGTNWIALRPGEYFAIGMGCWRQPPSAPTFNTHLIINFWYSLQP